MKSRKGKWTEEENQVLSNVVQTYMEKGETKTAAFRKAGELLGRTSSACGYRWNTVLCKKKKSTTSSPTSQLKLPPPKDYSVMHDQLDLNTVIAFLQQLNPMEDLLTEKKKLLNEQHRLKEKTSHLERIYMEKRKAYQELLQQYETFTELINDSKFVH